MIAAIAALVAAGLGGSALMSRLRSAQERDLDAYARGRDALARLHDGRGVVTDQSGC